VTERGLEQIEAVARVRDALAVAQLLVIEAKWHAPPEIFVTGAHVGRPHESFLIPIPSAKFVLDLP